eukprot:g9741.t1
MLSLMLQELRTVPEVHQSVISKLEDAYKMVRQAVVEFIFHLVEAGKVHEALVPGLSDEDPYVRQAAQEKQDEPMTATTKTITDSMCPQYVYQCTRYLHVQALGLLEDLAQEEAASVALRLRDPCWSVRVCAVRALHLIGAPAEAAPYSAIIAGLLGCGVKQLEETAVTTLKRIGIPAAAAVAPIFIHRAPPVHDPDNMLDDEIQEIQFRRWTTRNTAV